MILILMGVAGCGKTITGKALSKKLGIPFYDADDFHSKENKAKMARAIPLTDEDREGWLKALAAFMQTQDEMILACSALKASYRKTLQISPDVHFIYLKGEYNFIRSRLEKRKGHFFDPSLLQNQFMTLEEPQNCLVIDAALPLDTIVKEITDHLKIY